MNPDEQPTSGDRFDLLQCLKDSLFSAPRTEEDPEYLEVGEGLIEEAITHIDTLTTENARLRDTQWISVEDELPDYGDVVIVSGGTAQFRDGKWYTGMEEPLFSRPIQWQVTLWKHLEIVEESQQAAEQDEQDFFDRHLESAEAFIASLPEWKQEALKQCLISSSARAAVAVLAEEAARKSEVDGGK